MEEATLMHLLIILSLLVVLLSPRPAFAEDILSNGANITDDKTLVSSDGRFIMGFFSRGPAPTKRYYLGIWFSGSGSTDAVVWVANRERPVDKAGALVVSDTGSLVVLDGSMQVAWSSNSSSSSTSPVEAQLMNNGNLVVRNRGSTTVLWHSFGHPCHVLLSGMKVGRDFSTGAEWYLTSWRSADDPSQGAYLRKLDTSGRPDNIVWHGDVKTFRTGPWNGVRFGGIPEVLTYQGPLFEYQMVISSREVTYGYNALRGAPFTYVVLTEDGVVKRLVWDASSRTWQTPYQGPRDLCDEYGRCGAFGMCNASAASTGFCSCVKGFSPVSPSDWKAGCRRDVMLDCGKGPTTDGFMSVPGVKLADTHNASVDVSITVEDCKVRCLASCSCVAYAAADIRGNGSGCIIWTDNLIDLRYVDGGQLFYLRLPKSELGPEGSSPPGPRGTEKPSWLLPTIAVASVMVSILGLLALLFATGVLDWWNIWDIISQHDWERAVEQANQIPPFIDLSTIKRATRHFSRKNMIGQGTFAMVYEGNVPRRHPLVQGLPGRTIAVKRLKSIAGLPERIVNYYTREVLLVSTFNYHPNVLRFLAYCNKDNERILVYEYMHRSSLDVYIFGNRRKRALLSWQQRLHIIKGIADGVNHLSSARVIHRDLKPANVLLDGGWNAKVADFGTARLLLVDEATGTLPRIGTRGYMAPEYVRDEGQITLKCDVYSFGVTLLETLSGQKNNVGTNSLISKAWRLWVQKNIMALLDSEVASLPPSAKVADRLRRYIQIGLLCVQGIPEDRPFMHGVVEMLNNNGFDLVEPQMPNLDQAALREADLSVPTETQYATVNLRWQLDDNEREEIH